MLQYEISPLRPVPFSGDGLAEPHAYFESTPSGQETFLSGGLPSRRRLWMCLGGEKSSSPDDPCCIGADGATTTTIKQ